VGRSKGKRSPVAQKAAAARPRAGKLETEVTTFAAPAAIGPYVQARVAAGWLFCSGQIGLDPESGALVEGGAGAETRRVLANLEAVLSAAGVTFADVVKTTIFLADMTDFVVVNEAYAEVFRPPFPARATVAVAALPRGARVEIDAIARLPK
jgi:2-iminobutanoate/2-iminopropanoate deaminase